MKNADHSALRSYLAFRNSDRLIKLRYVAFAIVAVVALYFACGGPGITEAELAIASVLP
jgi:uncharacterized membrane protein